MTNVVNQNLFWRALCLKIWSVGILRSKSNVYEGQTNTFPNASRLISLVNCNDKWLVSASYALRMSMNIRFLAHAFLIPDQDHARRIVVLHLKEWLAYVHSELSLLFLLIENREVALLSHIPVRSYSTTPTSPGPYGFHELIYYKPG